MTVDTRLRCLDSACSQAAATTHPDEIVDDSVVRDDDGCPMTSSSSAPVEGPEGRGVYAMIEFGAEDKPRYRLARIQNFLYTASNDVRRGEDGGYVSIKERRRASSAVTVREEVQSTQRCNSTSSSSSSGGLRRKLNGAIKVVQKCKDAMQSGIRFRELRDTESVTSSGAR